MPHSTIRQLLNTFVNNASSIASGRTSGRTACGISISGALLIHIVQIVRYINNIIINNTNLNKTRTRMISCGFELKRASISSEDRLRSGTASERRGGRRQDDGIYQLAHQCRPALPAYDRTESVRVRRGDVRSRYPSGNPSSSGMKSR